MDDFNNNNNPFDEQKPDNTPVQPDLQNQTMQDTDPYNQSAQQNPYASQMSDPYNQPAQKNPYNQTGQNVNPYNMPQNPYNQGGQASNPYNQQSQQGNPYGQQSGQNPYAMPAQQSPYGQPNPYAAYGQQTYGMPYNPYMQKPPTGMAVASLVLGIISIVMTIPVLYAPFFIIIPIIGLILGIVFKSKRLPVGKGLSTAGIITSVCGIILPIALFILVAVLLFSHALDGFMAEQLKQLQQTDPDLYKQYYDMLGDTFPEWFEGMIRLLIGLK